MNQNQNKILVERLKTILKSSLDSILKKRGFKKQNNKYVFSTEYFIYELSLQKSQWNTQDKLSFTFNFSIWLAEKYAKKLPFPFLAPALSGNFFMFNKFEDGWFELKSLDEDFSQKDSMISEKIEQQVNTNVIPFLFSLHNIEDVINVLENSDKYKWLNPCGSEQTQEWIAILYYAIQQKTKSIIILDKLIKTTKNKPFKESIEELKSQIVG